MIVYDVTSEESMKSVEEWIKEYEMNNPCDFIISLVGNKVFFLKSKALSLTISVLAYKSGQRLNLIINNNSYIL